MPLMDAKPVTRIEVYNAVADAFLSPPVAPPDLIVAANRHGARTEVVNTLAQLPHDKTFRALREVWQYYPQMPTGSIEDL
jgi:hypothetical protein